MSKQLVTPAPLPSLLTEFPFLLLLEEFCIDHLCFVQIIVVYFFCPLPSPRSTELGSMSLTLEQFLASSSYNQTSDFYRTALVILALLFAVTVMLMLVIVTFYTVINIT